MIASITIGIPGTLAWVDTLFVLAPFCVGTIWVPQTLVGSAVIVRVTQVIFKTRANSPVVSWLTDCVLPTLLVDAGILAFTVKACFGKCTFAVTLTTS